MWFDSLPVHDIQLNQKERKILKQVIPSFLAFKYFVIESYREKLTTHFGGVEDIDQESFDHISTLLLSNIDMFFFAFNQEITDENDEPSSSPLTQKIDALSPLIGALQLLQNTQISATQKVQQELISLKREIQDKFVGHSTLLSENHSTEGLQNEMKGSSFKNHEEAEQIVASKNNFVESGNEVENFSRNETNQINKGQPSIPQEIKQIERGEEDSTKNEKERDQVNEVISEDLQIDESKPVAVGNRLNEAKEDDLSNGSNVKIYEAPEQNKGSIRDYPKDVIAEREVPSSRRIAENDMLGIYAEQMTKSENAPRKAEEKRTENMKVSDDITKKEDSSAAEGAKNDESFEVVEEALPQHDMRSNRTSTIPSSNFDSAEKKSHYSNVDEFQQFRQFQSQTSQPTSLPSFSGSSSIAVSAATNNPASASSSSSSPKQYSLSSELTSSARSSADRSPPPYDFSQTASASSSSSSSSESAAAPSSFSASSLSATTTSKYAECPHCHKQILKSIFQVHTNRCAKSSSSFAATSASINPSLNVTSSLPQSSPSSSTTASSSDTTSSAEMKECRFCHAKRKAHLMEIHEQYCSENPERKNRTLKN
ncbi:uncharacterized protein MONOS_3022 [Monocercomonoides exilis]|uniref:uncharacterized protein n=1 Tax=Monocercomonoides exilis TaxID=2049356 RepID=UPI0035597796|nr:hypothetical protein MONOS_3022 [Monocercomonoides exilis]|eukprot:MONOS_3022.1-p1 / transcript=MONOS_3022.1 / gene=MONOS_3022 / organism=Monocercomonoides_exilis_PA203 / gene_product=unspecified product / transcript_product=unspecified product / location=Mono_scaffold00067:41193-43333(-) / protein_length=598 / sequence_SO=supercontig / SO=protein_coding / is_pseudo=false